jgi:predicted enzyme related to lactoylglutathione lyase
MPPIVSFSHISIVAQDWERLAAFYEASLGFVRIPPVKDLKGEWLDASTGVPGSHVRGLHLRLPTDDDGPTLEILQYNGERAAANLRPDHPGLRHIAFRVGDIEAAQKAVVNAGGKSIGEVARGRYPGVRSAVWVYMADPEGNIIELQSSS